MELRSRRRLSNPTVSGTLNCSAYFLFFFCVRSEFVFFTGLDVDQLTSFSCWILDSVSFFFAVLFARNVC